MQEWRIDDPLYNKIINNMPIFCMDLIIRYDNKILLIKRKDDPAKGEFWTVGGRFIKGESIVEGALRKAKDEVNLDCSYIGTLDITNMYFEKVGSMQCDIHTPSLVIELSCNDISTLKLDNHHSEYMWVDKNSIKYHLYVQEILNKGGLTFE